MLAYILRLLIRQSDRVVAARVRVVARRLIRAEVDEQLARLLVLLGHSLPDDDDIAVESDARRLGRLIG